MPQISEVSIRYMRKIQVRDYEPAECEVALKATLLDGENAEQATKQILEFASGEVHEWLGLPRSQRLPSRAAGTKVGQSGPRPSAPEVSKVATEVAVVGSPAAADPTAIPDAPAPAAAAPKPVAAAADPSAIPEAPAKAPKPAAQKPAPAAQVAQAAPAPSVAVPAAGDAVATPGELSKWVGQKVREGKITIAAISAIYPKFGVNRLVDLKPEQVADCKKALDDALGAHAASDAL